MKVATELDSITSLIDCCGSTTDLCIDSLTRILASLELGEDWLAEHLPNPLPESGYHRTLLHQAKCFEIVLATWPVGGGTLVHDHGSLNSQGVVKVLQGNLFNQIYALQEDGTVRPGERLIAETGSTVPVTHDLIHAMGHGGGHQGVAASLHVYFPWIVEVRYWDPKTGLPVENNL
ncbi:cysteine dioxygenase [Acanthopleuribacter pedis]|uniref:Cysteine dioxygenase family protein n=1 Tax=Acanthopleuribacter pedis TaxID=442870 RepID=A0A8J7QPI0_9BACT|nr:cysteine dioxygenase family protein [Acanthopleuribacter pedis]MBO1322268.1 cysteine dioxygenase family protein [Acanthopleuribacter pedis]